MRTLVLFSVVLCCVAGCDEDAPSSASTFGTGGPNNRCVAASDCPADRPVCDSNRGECSECVQSSDCGAARPACNPENGRCEECLSNSDCPASEPACDPLDLRCEQACTADGDCGGGRTCSEDGRCIECVDDAGCDGGEPVCSSSGVCVECNADGDCGAGEPFCVANRCEDCTSDSHCGAGSPFCFDYECVECLGSNHCPDAEPICDNDGECRGCPDGIADCTGPVEIGDHCAPTNTCPGECVRGGDFPGGICTLECDNDADCPTDYRCVESEGGICLPSCDAEQTCIDLLGSDWRCEPRQSEGDGTEVTVCYGD